MHDFPKGLGNKNKKLEPVYFVGAGPGDPELLTIKARKLLDRADIIVFTGSLVPRAVIKDCRAEIYDSAGMHLEQVMKILVEGYRKGKRVVRLHTGDPSLYSAIAEQIRILKEKSVPFRVIPGVTAGFAASATIGAELTIPEKVQTVIISRISGRTPVPERESLERISRLQASLILYLSVGHIDEVVLELSKGYPLDTPVAVVEKATWPEERIVKGNLSDIADKVKRAGIKKTAVILVGQAIKGIEDIEEIHSRLYDKDFSHGYRTDSHEKQKILKTFSKNDSKEKQQITIVYLGSKGEKIAHYLKGKLEGETEALSFKKIKEEGVLLRKWQQARAMIFISACQIAVRTISPLVKDKYSDPAVIAVDESAKNCVCLLSGHLGGGNSLTRKVASILKASPIITTQSDLMNMPALDLWARANGLIPSNLDQLKKIQARFRDEQKLKLFLQKGVAAKSLPEGFEPAAFENDADVVIGPFVPKNKNALHLVTRNLSLGTGCHKGLPPERLTKRAEEFFLSHSIHPFAIKNICTIDKKAGETAIIELAKHLGATLRTFSPDELNKVCGIERSDAVFKAVGANAVAEPSALLCSPDSVLLVQKERFDCCTFAVAMEEIIIENGKKQAY